MPKMGETMETGTIEKWRKKEGDKVEKGEVLYDLATDKVSLEVESFDSGYLRKIVASEGTEVPIMEIIAYIGGLDEPIPGESIKEQASPQEVLPEKQTQDKKTEEKISISPLAKSLAEINKIDLGKVKGTGPMGKIVKEDVEKVIASSKEEQDYTVSGGRVFISPFAKKTAISLGVDINKIKGTGPMGRIVSADVKAFSNEAKEVKPQTGPSSIKILSSEPLKGVRKIISERMVEAKQNIPHILLYAVCDVTNLIALREKLKDRIEKTNAVKVTYTDFIIKTAASALKEFRQVNASLQNNTHIIYDDINIGIGVSVAATDTLIVPTIFNADKKQIVEIAKNRNELVEKGRDGKLSLEEISNATFTISNLGMFGVRSFTAIINPPQGAIMMVSEMYESPAAVNNQVEIRKFMEIGVAVDHRIIDGAIAARYLARVKEFIENPELLFL